MIPARLRGLLVDGSEYGLTLAVRTDVPIIRTMSDAASGTGGKGRTRGVGVRCSRGARRRRAVCSRGGSAEPHLIAGSKRLGR